MASSEYSPPTHRTPDEQPDLVIPCYDEASAETYVAWLATPGITAHVVDGSTVRVPWPGSYGIALAVLELARTQDFAPPAVIDAEWRRVADAYKSPHRRGHW